MEEVTVRTVDLDEIETDLLAAFNRFRVGSFERFNVLNRCGFWVRVSFVVERELGRGDDYGQRELRGLRKVRRGRDTYHLWPNPCSPRLAQDRRSIPSPR